MTEMFELNIPEAYVGTSTYGSFAPSMFLATCRPWLRELSQVHMHASVAREQRDDLASVLVKGAPEEPGPAHKPVGLEPAMGERLGELVPDEGAAQHDRDLRLEDPRDHAFCLVEVLEVEEVLR